MNPSLIYSHQTQRKSSFDLKRFNKALYTDALVAIYSSLRDLGTSAYINDHVRLLKRYMKKTPPLFLLPEFAYQSIPDPELFLHVSSAVAASGRPDLASFSKDILPRLNSPTQNLP